MMHGAQPRRIIVIGGGTAGWMTAAALSRFLERGWSITLVESDAIGTVGVGEATIPQILNFNAALGIDENDFIRATQATFKLGIAFEGWRAPGHRYCHGFGRMGRDLGLLGFYNYWLRGKQLGLVDTDDTSLDRYSVATQAAYAGRFSRPDAARPAPAGPHSYAFHFDAGLYAAYLRTYAEARGVIRHEGRIDSIERDPLNGDVRSVSLDNAVSVEGDLFIDCSGFHGLLLARALGVRFESWQHWLPCDRAFAVPTSSAAPPLPYTRSIARTAGWQWRIPLQHRAGNGLVFASSVIGEDAARAELLDNLDGQPLAEPRLIRFEAGRRTSVWSHNVIAIGLASGFLEPLESTSIHLIQTGIERLLKAMPSRQPTQAERDAFNAEARAEIEHVRDFIILHYYANGRDEPLWQQCRAMTLPDSLRERMTLFAETGRIASTAGQLFTEQAWQQVFIGQGVMPRAVHPLAERLSDSELAEFLGQNRRAVTNQVEAMPAHVNFIARHCAATPPPQSKDYAA